MSAACEAKQNAFPVHTVTILVLCMITTWSAFSLHMCVMVMDLLGLESTNEAGEMNMAIQGVGNDCTTKPPVSNRQQQRTKAFRQKNEEV